jgi:hypothetical protein
MEFSFGFRSVAWHLGAIIDGDISAANIVKIDKFSGLLASSSTPPELIEERVYGSPHCVLHYVDKENPLGPKPENPEKDPLYKNWEDAVQVWFKKENKNTSTDDVAPTEYDNVHTEANKPILSVISPINNASVVENKINAIIETSAPRGISVIEYSLNNSNFISTDKNNSFLIDLSSLKNGYHKLNFKVCDDVLNCTSTSTEFNLIK